MRPEQRRLAIVELLSEHHKLTVDFLAEHLSASKETIRRDLTDLANIGQLRKFHGGAAILDNTPQEGEFSARLSENAQEKRAIALAATALFHKGDSIFMDTGTTTLAFARELAVNAKDLTIITNSVSITQVLARSSGNHRVYLIGGEYREDAAENVGPLAVAQIAMFHVSDAVITVGAMDEHGVMDYDLEEAEIARAMIAQAKQVTVLADHSKTGRAALFTLCSLKDIHRLVTDRLPGKALCKALQDADIECIVSQEGVRSGNAFD